MGGGWPLPSLHDLVRTGTLYAQLTVFDSLFGFICPPMLLANMWFSPHLCFSYF